MVSLPRSLSTIQLTRRNRLILYYLLGIVLMIGLLTVVYDYGMSVFEGEPQSIFRSLGTVVETMTTTGYGADSPWESPVMVVLVVVMQVSGIALGFFTLRVIIIPLFTGAEVDLDSRLTPKRDHVVICEYRRESAVLLEELRELGIEYVLISSSKDNAKELSDQGYSAIHGSPQDVETFERASLDDARMVITDAGGANVNTILTVRSLRPDIDIVALTDQTDMEDVLTDAGATSVLSPHGLLGQRLAEKAVASFSSDLGETIPLGEDVELLEVPVDHGSPLVGRRIRNSRIRERTGANIIGAWIDGELQLPPDPDAIIRPNTVLVISGDHEALEAFSEFTRPPRRFRRHDRIVVVGYGDVGRAAQEVVSGAGIDVVTVDEDDHAGVDIVADVATKETLREAGIQEAGAIIVGVDDDSTALLVTVLARSLNPDIEILVRVSDTNATRKALSAGADYVLSVPRVSARMLARELRGEDVLAPASQIRLVRVPATPFAGRTLATSEIYEKTGCRVVAVEDDDPTSTVDPTREFSGSERLIVVGADESIQQFLKEFDVTPTEKSA